MAINSASKGLSNCVYWDIFLFGKHISCNNYSDVKAFLKKKMYIMVFNNSC